MQSDSLQAAAHLGAAGWVVTLLDGFLGAVAGSVAGWITATRIHKRVRRENREAVVRRLVAPTTVMIGDLRMARQNLRNADAQHDRNAVRAIFLGAEHLWSSDDADRLGAVVGGGAEQLDQQCYNQWLAVSRAAKDVAAKYDQIRALVRLADSGTDLTHHVGVYRGLLQDAIMNFEEALRSTEPYAASDSQAVLVQLRAGAA